MRTEGNSLEWYLKNSVGPILEKVKEANITESDQSKEKTVYKKETSDYLEKCMDEQNNVWPIQT